MPAAAHDQPASRFIVGIDLGTTNSSCAFVDTAEREWAVRDFLIPQLTAPSTVEPRETLPSFHYEPTPTELPENALALPWSSKPPTHGVGTFARDHGASVPGRLIASAKSWLSHRGVDRTAPLLPWHGASDVERLSPVDVSSRYLAHVRAAWDQAHPDHPLAQQDVVLTVPASFDEVARELTVEAARKAGLLKLTLVEEPQAAFYAWIHAQGDDWASQVTPGQKILVADVGGGTTDLTLIRVKSSPDGKVVFHRIAVGEHLILGGDNLDLGLAHHIESKVTNGGKLPPAQWGPVLRSARVAKETMLSDSPPESLTVNVSTGGAKLIGGAKQLTITRAEVHALLVDGFLPRVALTDKPTTRRSGFQEFGLPYAPDPAITKYLAAFLSTHNQPHVTEDGTIQLRHDPARPDVLLFNGGFFASPQLRERFIEVLSSWFQPANPSAPRWRPLVLHNDRLDLAVSRGAAYYGMVRKGKGVRIRGGLAHSYYIGVETTKLAPAGTNKSRAIPPSPGTPGEGQGEGRAANVGHALCLLPAGVEEGQDVPLNRTFNLLIRQPVEFPLYYSATRTTDPPGGLVEVDPEQLTSLPPIRTVLQSGKKSAADTVQVNLHAKLTEIGTLDLWAQETKGDRQWRLQFDVRSASRAEVSAHESSAESQGYVDSSLLPPAMTLIREAFTATSTKPNQLPAPATPQTLTKRLELILTLPRTDWPASLLRSLWETLYELSETRRRSIDHESRWLGLAGFCLRPGYGLAVDDWRVAQMWRLFPQKLTNPKNEQVRAEWWILWRRLAGGLSAGQQLTLAEPLIPALKSRLRPSGALKQPATSPYQYGPHETAEVYRLLGSLELLRSSVKEDLASHLLDHLPREKADASRNANLFAVGRIASRVPVYGPLNALLPPDKAEEFATRLLAANVPATAQLIFTLTQLTRLTHDRYRDVSNSTRTQVLDFLRQHHAPEHYLSLVHSGGQLREEEQSLAFGESLPRGLRIE